MVSRTANNVYFVGRELAASEEGRLQVINDAERLIRSLENPGEVLARIGWGEPSRTAALRAAFELGLLKELHDDPMSSSQLAAASGADPALIGRIMKHLAAHGLVKEHDADSYCATPFSRATKDPSISGGQVYSFEGMIPTFHSLPEFLARTKWQDPSDANNGPVQLGLKMNKPFFAVLHEDVKLGSAFNNFMTGYAQARPRWVDYYPCEKLLKGLSDDGLLLVDVGGGLGSDILSFNAQHPGWSDRLLLQDTSEVISQAQMTIGTSSQSVKLLAHDFFTPQPESAAGARAYFLRLVLHDWSDEKCEIILSHVREAMKPGYSKLLINENVLSDTNAPWQQTSLDWTMMAMLVNRERTERQWRELLARSGFKVTGIWQKHAASESVIEAVLDREE